MRFSLPLFISLGLLVPALAAPEDPATETTTSTIVAKQAETALPFTEQSATPTEEDQYTIFNDARVPPLKELNGTTVEDELKDGYWFVKHYSPYCWHCKAVAPIWQTLYEFYYVSESSQSSYSMLILTDIETRTSLICLKRRLIPQRFSPLL